jgi:hypothetical protein
MTRFTFGTKASSDCPTRRCSPKRAEDRIILIFDLDFGEIVALNAGRVPDESTSPIFGGCA